MDSLSERDKEKILEAAYHEYYRRLAFFIEEKWHIKDGHEIITLINDAFMVLKNKEHNFKEAGTLSKLFKILEHDCIDYWRRRNSEGKRFRQWLSDSISALEEEENPYADSEKVRTELLQRLRTNVEKLTPGQKALVKAILMNGQKAKDFARDNGIHPNTVTGTKQRSIRLLKEMLKRNDTIAWLIIPLLLLDQWKN